MATTQRSLLLVFYVLLVGCTQERPHSASLVPSAATFTYFTPVTKLKLSGELVLEACDAESGIIASSSLALVNFAGADKAHPFVLNGTYLMSGSDKRELAIELHENGTIKSLNTTSSDRTGEIITNILKTVGSVAGAVFGVAAPTDRDNDGDVDEDDNSGACNDETWNALVLVERFKDALEGERANLLGASPVDAEAIGKKIDLLAQQLAHVRGTQLTIKLEREIPIGDAAVADAPLNWTFADLRKWFDQSPETPSCESGAGPTRLNWRTGIDAEPCKMVTDQFAIVYTISADNAAPPAQRIAASPCTRADAAEAHECRRTIVMVTPTPAKVQFKAAGPGFPGHPAGTVLGSLAVPMPQWGHASYLPLSAKTFQSRTIGYTFDQFGQRQSFKWNSEATAENATAALARVAEAGKATLTTLQGPTDTARWKAEIDELETRMKLNKLRLCEEAIKNGAVTCE